MNNSHHPSDATLLAHAAGNLDEACSVIVATHLGFCPTCRKSVRVCEAIGGQILATLPVSAMSADALSQALARLDRPVAQPALPPSPSPPDTLGFKVPVSLRPYPIPGWGWVAPGIRHIRLFPRRAGRSGLHLLNIAPGMAIPEHGHGGNEFACILAGSYSDETGRLEMGDFAEMGPEEQHKPVADAHKGCICVIATDAPLRFRSLLPRLVQPVVGF